METRTRYENLLKAIDEIEDKKQGTGMLRFLEIGTYDGARADGLLRYWLRGKGRRAAYIGLDLFEDMTQRRTAEEMSKSRLPPSIKVVHDRLKKTGADVRLVKGDTRMMHGGEKSPHVLLGSSPMDLIFIDGGHSLETIDSDWRLVQSVITVDTIVLLDDYYVNRSDFGCQQLVNRLTSEAPEFSVILLDPIDHYDHTGLDIRMVRVQRKFNNGSASSHAHI